MILTTTWMANNFAQFNIKYFHAMLPTPRFIIVDSNAFFGQCGAKNWRAEHPDFYLKLSNHTERTEYQFQCTLLHEMIHLYWQSKGEWNVGHGDKFVEMALRFRRMGWDIHIKRDSKSQKSNVAGKSINLQPASKPNDKASQGLECLACLQPSVTWLQIWYTQVSNSVQVHCKFVIDRMKGKTCSIFLEIYERRDARSVNIDTRSLPDAYKYRDVDTMCLKRTLTASFDSTIWKDLRFNIPYSVLVPNVNKLFSIFGLKKKRMFHLKLYIAVNGKIFDKVAVQNMTVNI